MTLLIQFPDYEQYYASLAASSSAAASAIATPSGLSLPGSSDFGDLAYQEEIDQKPSVEYLDSLNEYRKRSRSGDDEGTNAREKVTKVDVGPDRHTYFTEKGIVPVEGNTVLVVEVQPPVLEDDPIVYGKYLCLQFFSSVNCMTLVNGEPMAYSSVTEEDHDLMTPDEYTAFFEIMQARS